MQAYVSDYNIFFKSNVTAEAVQVTHNGKKNEILNGVPDWVYGGKFDWGFFILLFPVFTFFFIFFSVCIVHSGLEKGLHK